MLHTKFLRLAAFLLILSYSSFSSAKAEISAFSGLPPAAKVELVDRFGEGAALVAEVNQILGTLSAKGGKGYDRARLAEMANDLSQVDHAARGQANRRKVSRAWKKLAEFTFHTDGPSEEMLAHLERALALDSSDASLLRMVKQERLRKELAQKRAAEAERVRQALARGEDPFETDAAQFPKPSRNSSSKVGGAR